jgi:hypothetical protein
VPKPTSPKAKVTANVSFLVKRIIPDNIPVVILNTDKKRRMLRHR